MIVLEAYGKVGVPWGNSQMRKIPYCPSSAAQLLEQKLLRLLVKVRELQDANLGGGGAEMTTMVSDGVSYNPKKHGDMICIYI